LSTGRKAQIAINSFKWLIVICCLALVLVSLDFGKSVESNLSVHGYGTLFFSCAIVVVIAYLLAGAFFMVWFYAAYQTVYREAPESLRFAPIWTVLGFSVPVANLFLPYVLVVVFLRRLTRRQAAGGDATDSQPPAYFKIWWLSHLLVFFGIPLSFVLSLVEMDRGSLVLMQFLLSVAALLLICNSARLAIRLVKELEGMFEAVFGGRAV
jgi:hypothetical protein